jgi:hypothetical protein
VAFPEFRGSGRATNENLKVLIDEHFVEDGRRRAAFKTGILTKQRN